MVIFAVKFGKSVSISLRKQCDSLSCRREITLAVSIKTGTVYRSRPKDRFGENQPSPDKIFNKMIFRSEVFFVPNRINRIHGVLSQ